MSEIIEIKFYELEGLEHLGNTLLAVGMITRLKLTFRTI